MFHIVKDPMDSLLDKYWWVPRAQAIYQPHLRSGLAHDILGEKTTVFCKIKEDKKTMQKKERERERGISNKFQMKAIIANDNFSLVLSIYINF